AQRWRKLEQQHVPREIVSPLADVRVPLARSAHGLFDVLTVPRREALVLHVSAVNGEAGGDLDHRAPQLPRTDIASMAIRLRDQRQVQSQSRKLAAKQVPENPALLIVSGLGECPAQSRKTRIRIA